MTEVTVLFFSGFDKKEMYNRALVITVIIYTIDYQAVCMFTVNTCLFWGMVAVEDEFREIKTIFGNKSHRCV